MDFFSIKKKYFGGLSAIFFLFPITLLAQLNGNILNETQVGNIPKREPNNLITNYTRLNLNYEYKNFSFRSMSEVFISQNANTSYIFPSQIGIQYKYKRLDLKLGNTFNANATWVDKIVFVLKEASRPLRSSDIIDVLLKNDISFRTITNKQKGLFTHLTKALKYGRIIGTKQKRQNRYLFSLPE